MAVLYTKQEIEEALRELRILPINGKVNTNEAARILSWRAKAEHGIEHTYNPSAVRRHVQMGNLSSEVMGARSNQYRVEDLFIVPLAPKRGQRQSSEDEQYPDSRAVACGFVA